ncbi:ankyrin repeat domain-containing protein [Streptomyces sp. NPDC001902]
MNAEQSDRIWRMAIDAARRGHLDSLRTSVETKLFDRNRPDRRGMTLLHHAVAAEIERAWSERRGRAYVDCVAYLLIADVDFTVRDVEGRTAEDIASMNGHWLAEGLLRAWGRLHGAGLPSETS